MSEDQEKNKTVVSIYGQQYTIVGNEKEEHVRKVASLVDKKMRELKKSNPYLDSTKLAVLTALNIGNDYLNLLDEFNLLYELIESDNDKKDGDL